MATNDFQQNSESKSSSFSTPREKSKSKLAKNKASQKEELEEKLVHEHYGLVVSQALYFLDDSNLDDYIQAGLIGLLKAIRNHDENKAKFSTFAIVCIRNEMKNLNKKSKKHRSKNFTNATRQDKQYNIKETLSDYLPEFLPEEYKFIISLKIQSYTNAEISDFISCSKNDVKEKIELIIKLLKEYNI